MANFSSFAFSTFSFVCRCNLASIPIIPCTSLTRRTWDLYDLFTCSLGRCSLGLHAGVGACIQTPVTSHEFWRPVLPSSWQCGWSVREGGGEEQHWKPPAGTLSSWKWGDICSSWTWGWSIWRCFWGTSTQVPTLQPPRKPGTAPDFFRGYGGVDLPRLYRSLQTNHLFVTLRHSKNKTSGNWTMNKIKVMIVELECI